MALPPYAASEVIPGRIVVKSEVSRAGGGRGGDPIACRPVGVSSVGHLVELGIVRFDDLLDLDESLSTHAEFLLPGLPADD